MDTPAVIPFLLGLEDGRLMDDCDAQLRELVAALRRHVTTTGGKPKAKLTLTLALIDDGTAVEVVGSVTTTRPAPVRQRSLCFRGEGDTLSAVNPRQLPLDFANPAAAERGPIRSPDDAGPAVRLAK